MSGITIRESIDAYLHELASKRSRNTFLTYRRAMTRFVDSIRLLGIDLNAVETSHVSEDWIVDFAKSLEEYAPSTRNVYLQGVIRWYDFLKAEKYASVDMQRVRSSARPYIQEPVQDSSRPPSYSDISRVVSYAMGLATVEVPNERARLRSLRDRALIVTLTDTGLELRTVYKLRCGDVDWRNSRFVLSQKDGTQASVRFSPRVRDVLHEYLNARATLDKAMSCSQASLPLFASHGTQVGKQVRSLRLKSAEQIVAQRVRQALEPLGFEYDGTITPKSLSQYSVDAILQLLGLLHPKIVEGCQALLELGRYDDAIFAAMRVVEEEIRSVTSLAPSDIGARLITKAMKPKETKPPLIEFSSVEAEQESAFFLFRGAFGVFKNPRSHRSPGTSDPMMTFECLALASLLMRMLDEAA